MSSPLSFAFLAAATLLAGAVPPAAAQSAAGPALRPPAKPQDCRAGSYDGHQMEMAAELELGSDGRFRYGLAYGALDEEAAGRWESDGESLFLTSDPLVAPRFAQERKGAAPAGQFILKLEAPRGLSLQYFTVRLAYADGRVSQSQLGDEGLTVTLKPGERIASATLLLAVYELQSESFPIDAGGGTEVVFGFSPNDLGKVAFARTALKIDKSDLLLERHDREIRFRAIRGGCPG